MNPCPECGAELAEVTGTYQWGDRWLGQMAIDEATYQKCTNCGARLLPMELASRCDAAQAQALEKRLLALPIGEFLSERETYKRLGISKQALHENKRVRRQLIYHVVRDGSRFFLRRSVEKYLASGKKDGRVRLAPLPSKDPLPLTKAMVSSSANLQATPRVLSTVSDGHTGTDRAPAASCRDTRNIRPTSIREKST